MADDNRFGGEADLDSVITEDMEGTLGEIEKREEAAPTPTPAPALTPAPVKVAQAAPTPPKLGKEPQAATPPDVPKVPSGLNGKIKEKWATMDPEVRAEIAKREDDFHNAFQQSKGYVDFGNMMWQEVQPYEAMMRSQGLHPAAVVREMMQGAYVLNHGSMEQKAEVIARVIRAKQIPYELLNAFLNGQPAGDAALPKEFVDLREQVQRLESGRQQAVNWNQQQQVGYMQQQIAACAADTQRFPYFDVLRPFMASLLFSGQIGGNTPAEALQYAYEMAAWAHPQVRAQLMASQQAAERKKAEEAAKKAREAASVNVRESPGFSSAQAFNGTMDDTMHEVYRSIMGR
jgi:hypothetical protein